jgi:hypothetical protein
MVQKLDLIDSILPGGLRRTLLGVDATRVAPLLGPVLHRSHYASRQDRGNCKTRERFLDDADRSELDGCRRRTVSWKALPHSMTATRCLLQSSFA